MDCRYHESILDIFSYPFSFYTSYFPFSYIVSLLHLPTHLYISTLTIQAAELESRSLIHSCQTDLGLGNLLPPIHQKPHGWPHTSGSTPLYLRQRLIDTTLNPALEPFEPQQTTNSTNRKQNSLTITTTIAITIPENQAIAMTSPSQSSHQAIKPPINSKWHVIPPQTRFPAFSKSVAFPPSPFDIHQNRINKSLLLSSEWNAMSVR